MFQHFLGFLVWYLLFPPFLALEHAPLYYLSLLSSLPLHSSFVLVQFLAIGILQRNRRQQCGNVQESWVYLLGL